MDKQQSHKPLPCRNHVRMEQGLFESGGWKTAEPLPCGDPRAPAGTPEAKISAGCNFMFNDEASPCPGAVEIRAGRQHVPEAAVLPEPEPAASTARHLDNVIMDDIFGEGSTINVLHSPRQGMILDDTSPSNLSEEQAQKIVDVYYGAKDIFAAKDDGGFAPDKITVASVAEPAPTGAVISKGLSISSEQFRAALTEPSKEDLGDVLRRMPGYVGGPSDGGLSPHTMEDYSCLRRFYRAHVLGQVSADININFSTGSLHHAVMAMLTLYGEEQARGVLTWLAEEEGSGKYATEIGIVSALFEGYLKSPIYRADLREWTVPKVEQVLRAKTPPVKIGSDFYRISISGRYDDARLPKVGVEPRGETNGVDGLVIHDWKTSSMITRVLRSGFGRDWQLRVYSCIYQYGGWEAEFGPLHGVAVTLFLKPASTSRGGIKVIDPAADIERIIGRIKPIEIEKCWTQEVIPRAESIARRLLLEKQGKGGPDLWPENTTQCVGRWGPCAFFWACDIGKINHHCEPGPLRIDESRIIRFDDIVEKVSKTLAGKLGSGTDSILKKKAAGLLAEWLDKVMAMPDDKITGAISTIGDTAAAAAMEYLEKEQPDTYADEPEAWRIAGEWADEAMAVAQEALSYLVNDVQPVKDEAGNAKRGTALLAPIISKIFRGVPKGNPVIPPPLLGLRLDLGGVKMLFDGKGSGPCIVRDEKGVIRIGSRQVAEALSQKLFED